MAYTRDEIEAAAIDLDAGAQPTYEPSDIAAMLRQLLEENGRLGLWQSFARHNYITSGECEDIEIDIRIAMRDAGEADDV